MYLLAALFAVLFGVQEDLDSLYKFKKDTTWTYKRIRHHDDHTHDSQVIYKIIKMEEDTSVIDISTNGQAAPLFWKAADGYLMYGTVSGDKPKLAIRAYKAGAKEGDTWNAAGPDLPALPEGSSFVATHKGTKEVEVPAGKLNAIWIQAVATNATSNQTMILDYYFVRSMGLVKYVVQSPWAGPDVLVLEKFEEGK